MSVQHVSLLLAVLGGTLLLLSWVGRRKGDAARDMALMLAIGASTSAASGVLYLVG
jgi:hypothetical protein